MYGEGLEYKVRPKFPGLMKSLKTYFLISLFQRFAGDTIKHPYSGRRPPALDFNGSDILKQQSTSDFSSFLVRHRQFSIGSCFSVLKVNSLPNDKILDMTKLRAFAGDKINVAQMMIFVFDRVENIVGKGENAGYQHFLLFPTMFSKGFFLGVVKSRDCEVKS